MTAFTAATAAVLTAAPAQASTTPVTDTATRAWRTSFRASTGSTSTATVATGKSTAWTFTSDSNGSKPRAYHLTGGKWRASALPRAVDELVLKTSASSDRNVWAGTLGSFTSSSAGVSAAPPAGHPGLGAAASRKGVPARVLRWDGRKWTIMKSFPNTMVTAIAAPSARDAWVFTVPTDADAMPAIWHFDGRTWKRTATRVQVSDVVFRSSRDIWAAGFDNTRDGTSVVAHFDGRAWKRERLPRSAADVFFFGITADRDRVWVSADGMNDKGYAFFKDRRGWHRELIPGAGHLSPAARPFVTDRGEFAIMTMPIGENTPAPYRERNLVFHRKSAGKWHVDLVPEKVDGRLFDPWEGAAPLRGTGTILIGGSLGSRPAVVAYRPNH
ncbi:hypothetical protein DZF91_06860 [Actinomadura logoneensis]|uniref:WD40 repeat domain-containing protein n=1 Tax=Actinomadura logoneensis TaxID=2293572 RepID=A0A372JRF8_9ACTN|nr:hypothetical protein [Actinomadura logoneensis]RFU42376.1 hypothetical protein DZF91_06860 [Actinomadura logoneensis]